MPTAPLRALAPDSASVRIGQIVKGAIAEIERNGPATPLKIARGKNALWSAGGLQYAPPSSIYLKGPAKRRVPFALHK
jgi:hypothetical protein